MDRVAYAGDMWPLLQVRKLAGKVAETQPACVVWPETAQEVATVLRLCNELRVPVVPYGAGSGVCGGAMSEQAGITLDLRRLDRVVAVEPVSALADVEAGVLGHLLEQALDEQGITLGHFPSSILCSTVGGWVATRSAGQFSSRYGKIEDMVAGLEVALPSGELLRTGALGPTGGFDWSPIFVGSEGTLGVVTRALLRVHRKPEHRAFRGLRFPDLESGVDAMRRVMQDGLTPVVMRLYDGLDTLLSSSSQRGGEPEHADKAARSPSISQALRERLRLPRSRDLAGFAAGWLRDAQSRAMPRLLEQARTINRVAAFAAHGCKMVLGFEGRADLTTDQMTRALALCQQSGGVDQGEKPGRHWLEHRYAVSFKQSKVYASGAFVDTMEVATPWSRLVDVYDAVRSALSPLVIVMAHFSHAYVDGCSIYFTFAGAGPSAEATEELYRRTWHVGLDAVVQAGAAVSHHHGIGLLKRDALARQVPAGAHVFGALKAQFDPNGILNPGKLYRLAVAPGAP
jgi:alkyldihydroxyacetonephosphate synthase